MKKKLEDAAQTFVLTSRLKEPALVDVISDALLKRAFLAGARWMNEECAHLAIKSLNYHNAIQAAEDIRALMKEKEKN